MDGAARRLALRALYLGVVGVLIFAAAELVVRWRGFAPFAPTEIDTVVEPGGRLFEPHPTLGYAHLPGRFTITLGTGHRFVVTHGEDSLRITRPPGGPPRAAQPEIWILGGSFTHGWSVDDAESYPWLLQERLPDRDVVNFGVSGYGTLHALTQLREGLAAGRRPEAAVIAYLGFHDVRNTFARSRRKYLVPWSRLGPLDHPRARFDEQGRLHVSTVRATYREVPLMRYSALVHFAEQRYDRWEEEHLRSHLVSRSLVNVFARMAREAGVRPLVVGLDTDVRTAALVDWAAEAGIESHHLGVDLGEPGLRNLPFDDHPSPRAHRLYAERLARVLVATPRGGERPGRAAPGGG